MNSATGYDIRHLLGQANIGLPSRPLSNDCARIMKEIEESAVDPVQKVEGITNGIVREGSCLQLLKKNLLGYKTQEEQEEICLNTCYEKMLAWHSQLLKLNCFDGNGTSEHESANGKLQAAAYELACQKDLTNLYCVSVMGEQLATQDDEYDLCNDVVANWGCCFQNYKLYIQKFGLKNAKDSVQKVEQDCGEVITKEICPCDDGMVGMTNVTLFLCKGSITASSTVLAVAIFAILEYALL